MPDIFPYVFKFAGLMLGYVLCPGFVSVGVVGAVTRRRRKRGERRRRGERTVK